MKEKLLVELMDLVQLIKNKNMKNLHNYLSKPKFRALVLLPPLTLCVIGVIVAFAHTFSHFGFNISHFVQWTFLGGAIWMLLGMWLILWSDYKRSNI